MFPIRDDNPQIDTPVATYTLIALNVIAWVALQGLGTADSLNASICQYGLIPADVFPSASGADGPRLCPAPMAGSWMHIIGNMWFLFVFGDNVEDSMGPVRFAIFYLLCGLCAAAAQIAVDPGSRLPMVGASGAIGGVMGAYIMLYPRVHVHMAVILVIFFWTFRIPAIAMLGYWIVMQFVGGVSSLGGSGGGVAFWAHIGGFLGGAALVWLFKDDELLLNHPYHGWNQATDPTDIWKDPKNRQ
jgi:membrane associated rhomboid family serine protease